MKITNVGQTTNVENEQIKDIFSHKGHINIQKTAEKLNVSHTKNENHMKGLGFTKTMIFGCQVN